ncbi:MAG: ferrochelatase [Candidatus Azobacteroides sp.]|nr:ferrochelatase [Candidatus Azobacteroides sp.]
MKIAVLLINLGSPENASPRKVAGFLYRMLNDVRVIDLPFIIRKLLVNLVIIPFRVRASSKKYAEYFNGKPSPLLTCSLSVEKKLNEILPSNYRAFSAMRYGNPSLKTALQQIIGDKYERILVFPQYPQYAEAVTLSSIEKAEDIAGRLDKKVELQIIRNFHDHPLFIECLSNKIRKYNPADYDRVIFSYHSLPLRQINKVHARAGQSGCNCSEKTPENSGFCYKAACYETSGLIARDLKLKKDDYLTSFQSQMGKNWLQPATGDVLISEAEKGNKRILIVSPSFVADCLETTMELGVEYNDLFRKHGGKCLQPVECLNDDEEWVQALAEMITTHPFIQA